jgi:hypothetical protein
MTSETFDNVTVNKNLVVQENMNTQFFTYDMNTNSAQVLIPITVSPGGAFIFNFDSLLQLNAESTFICNGTAQFGNIVNANISGSAESVRGTGITGTLLPENIVSSSLKSLGILSNLTSAGDIKPFSDGIVNLGSSTNRFNNIWSTGKICCANLTDLANSPIGSSSITLSQSIISASGNVNLGSITLPFGNVYSSNIFTNFITNRANSPVGSQNVILNQNLIAPSGGQCSIGTPSNWFGNVVATKITSDLITSRTLNNPLTLAPNGTGTILFGKLSMSNYTNTFVQNIPSNTWTVVSVPTKIFQYGLVTYSNGIFVNTGVPSFFDINLQLGWQTTGSAPVTIAYQLSTDTFVKRYYVETRTLTDIGVVNVTIPVSLNTNTGIRIVVFSKDCTLVLNPTLSGADLQTKINVKYISSL